MICIVSQEQFNTLWNATPREERESVNLPTGNAAMLVGKLHLAIVGDAPEGVSYDWRVAYQMTFESCLSKIVTNSKPM